MSFCRTRLIPLLVTGTLPRIARNSLRNIHNLESSHIDRAFFNKFNSNTSRSFSAMSENRIVTYEDVVTYKDKPDVYLIDVREPKELQETGIIPSGINIPLGNVTPTLQNGNPADFKSKFGRDFPEKNKELVFYCKMGGRATKAMDQAIQLGFANSKVYKGSWEDWASHQSK